MGTLPCKTPKQLVSGESKNRNQKHLNHQVTTDLEAGTQTDKFYGNLSIRLNFDSLIAKWIIIVDSVYKRGGNNETIYIVKIIKK